MNQHINIDFCAEALEILPVITVVRRQIHCHPEIGGQEYATAELIEKFLSDCGIETKRLTETAVLGILHGAKPGKTVALRADIDALPIREKTELEYASQNDGVMHACGHDLHTSAVLGAAKILSRHRDELNGTVKFFFEPDEEGMGGAKPMLEAGCMECPTVDAVFGAHVNPDLPLGTVGIRYGKFYAASNPFHITLHGKSAHGAEPEKAVDALNAALHIIQKIKTLPDTYAKEKCVLSVCTMQAGTGENIIADTADFGGILRTLGAEDRKSMTKMLQATVEQEAQKLGVRAEVRIRESYPGVVNDKDMTELAEQTAKDLFGNGVVCRLEQPTMTTEDFGYFLESAPGSFYQIGVGGGALHSDDFAPDDSVLKQLTALHSAICFIYLI